MNKIRLNLHLTPHTNINSKQMKDININIPGVQQTPSKIKEGDPLQDTVYKKTCES